MKPILRSLSLLILTCSIPLAASAADSEEGFVPLMDGKTFNGWKISEENPSTWKIEDGAFVAQGPRSHLFYEGDGKPFKNFHFKAEVMTEPGSNGGIYFHTQYQPNGWPKAGFETQVNNTHTDVIKTGSLYGLVNIHRGSAEDKKWWTQEIIVKGNSVTMIIDGKVLFQYNEPPGTAAGKDFGRKINEGTFALQGHDPKSIVRYKNIRAKRLD
jgi:hypothetical protein